MDKTFSVSPVLLDLYPALKIYLTAEEFFHVLTCVGGNTLEGCALLADDNTLVAFSFAVNCCFNVHKVFI